MKTSPVLLTFVLWAGLALIAAGQNPQPPDKKDADDKSPDPVARVARNMESSEERLKKADPGDVTRKIQRDIIDGLDELIKKNGQEQGAKGAKGGSPDKSSQGKSKASRNQSGAPQRGQQNKSDSKPSPADDDPQSAGRAKTGKDEGPQAKAKNKGKGNDKEATGKDAGKDDKEDEDAKKGMAKGDPKDGKDGGQQGTAKSQKANNVDLLADQHRTDLWGHLPLTKRLEMDAYAKQRFMPRYETTLQEYYRSISEQGQRKK